MLLLSTLQQFDINPTDFLILLATAGLILFFLLAAFSTPLLALSAESAYVLRRKAFYDKCALQISQAAFGIGIFIFLLLAGGALYLGLHLPPDFSDESARLFRSEAPGLTLQLWGQLGYMLFFVPPLTGLILFFAYLAVWPMLKKRRAAHLILGWLCALFMLALLLCTLVLAWNAQSSLLLVFLIHNPLPVLLALLADFFASPAPPLIFACLVCLGLAAGAGLSQLWLIMRRFKADYGRDYYAFAMRYCARTALGFTLASLVCACAVWLLLRSSVPPELTQPQDLGLTIIALGLPLSCCLLWFSIAKSETPLRHKPGAFFACVFLVIALCAQLLMLANTFPLA